MKHPAQIRAPQGLAQIAQLANKVYIRLALTTANDGKWLARNLIIDVFPQAWVDNPTNVLDDYQAKLRQLPNLFEKPGKVLFFHGLVPSSIPFDWLAHPDDCELTAFDSRLGQSDRVLRFRMPKFFPDVNCTHVNSKHRIGNTLLPWPNFGYYFRLNNAYGIQPGDEDPLYVREGVQRPKHFSNFSHARAKFIYDVTDISASSYDDHDEIMLREIDGRGWIREVRKQERAFDVLVHGLDLYSCHMVLKRPGEDDEVQPLMEPGKVRFIIENDPDVVDFILATDDEELDRARYVSSATPYHGHSSPHVVIEEVAVSKPTAEEAAQDATNSVSQSPATVATPPSVIVPPDVVMGSRAYIERVVKQINITYQYECYDACAVMIRRLIETLIIEVFEANGIADHIQDDNQQIFFLEGLISKTLSEKQWHIGRGAQNALKKLKEMGDKSAHDRRYNARQEYIDEKKDDIRTVVHELVELANFTPK